MPKVICTNKNASTLISGVHFVTHADGGMISQEISQEAAGRFLKIPGYKLANTPTATGATGTPEGGGKSGTDKDGNGEDDTVQLARLRARGIELKIPHAEQKGLRRLTEEVAEAEKKLAEGSAGAST